MVRVRGTWKLVDAGQPTTPSLGRHTWPARFTASLPLIPVPWSTKEASADSVVNVDTQQCFSLVDFLYHPTQPSAFSHLAQGRCSFLKPLLRRSSPFITQPYRLISLTCSSRYNLYPATELVSIHLGPSPSALLSPPLAPASASLTIRTHLFLGPSSFLCIINALPLTYLP
jgi:hypothetical protein